MFPRLYQILSILVLLAAASLVACKQEPELPAETEPLPSLANPASVYCQGLDYQEENREDEAGQYGVCIFPDGSECDSWDFLAGRCGQEHSYCVQQGFEIESNPESNIATCVFDDGTTCNEFEYFQGECKPGEPYP